MADHRIIKRNPWYPLIGVGVITVVFIPLGLAHWFFLLLAAVVVIGGVFIWTAQLKEILHKEVVLLLQMGEFRGFLKPGWVFPWPGIEEILEANVVKLAGEAFDPMGLSKVISLDSLPLEIDVVLTFDIEDVREDTEWNRQAPYIWVYSFQNNVELREGLVALVDSTVRQKCARLEFDPAVGKTGEIVKEGVNTSQRILALLLKVEVTAFLRDMACIPRPSNERDIIKKAWELENMNSSKMINDIDDWLLSMRKQMGIRLKSVGFTKFSLDEEMYKKFQEIKKAEIDKKARILLAEADKIARSLQGMGDMEAVKFLIELGLLPDVAADFYATVTKYRELAKHSPKVILADRGVAEKLEISENH